MAWTECLRSGALDQRRETRQEEERGRRECFPQAVGRTQDRAAEGRQLLTKALRPGREVGPLWRWGLRLQTVTSRNPLCGHYLAMGHGIQQRTCVTRSCFYLSPFTEPAVRKAAVTPGILLLIPAEASCSGSCLVGSKDTIFPGQVSHWQQAPQLLASHLLLPQGLGQRATPGACGWA